MKRRELANQDVRKIIKDAGLRHFEICDAMGISHSWFTILMQRPLPQDKREEILSIVKQLSEEVNYE